MFYTYSTRFICCTPSQPLYHTHTCTHIYALSAFKRLAFHKFTWTKKLLAEYLLSFQHLLKKWYIMSLNLWACSCELGDVLLWASLVTLGVWTCSPTSCSMMKGNTDYCIYATCILWLILRNCVRCVYCLHFTNRKIRLWKIEQYAWDLKPNCLTP